MYIPRSILSVSRELKQTRGQHCSFVRGRVWQSCTGYHGHLPGDGEATVDTMAFYQGLGGGMATSDAIGFFSNRAGG